MNKGLKIKVSGRITESNFSEYKEAILAQLDGLKAELITDQDFADAKKTIKVCKAAEDEIALAKSYAMEEAVEINDLFCSMDEVLGKLRDEIRLPYTRQVKAEETSRKTAIIKSGSDAVNEFMSGQHAAVKLMDIDLLVFADVAKGKRTLKSMQDSVDNAAAELIANIQRTAELVENNLAVFESIATGYSSLFHDKNNLLIASEGELVATVEGRIAKAKLEERERIEREEREKRAREYATSAAKESMACEEREVSTCNTPAKNANQVVNEQIQPTTESRRYIVTMIVNGTKDQAKEIATVARNATKVNFDGLIESVSLDFMGPG
ncbi:MAG: hypothetical protein ABFQ95_07810 [Pseudomonadota bacterium]